MALNTLTAARKALTLDDVRFVGQLAQFLVDMIEHEPNQVVKHYFTAWMRAKCSEVDDGTRAYGSSTEQMLDFYKIMAEGLRDRVAQGEGR